MTMRQAHAAGDKLFVDYAGDGVAGGGRPPYR
ncbi:transposase [Bradyrhizobium sp. GM6.1]